MPEQLPQNAQNKRPDDRQLEGLTRQQLFDLEKGDRSTKEKVIAVLTLALPVICCGAAIAEYLGLPDKFNNPNPYLYVYVLLVLLAYYLIKLGISVVQKLKGSNAFFNRVLYRAPLFSAFFLLLTAYDYLTVKTGILTHPFVPCMNLILNAAIIDHKIILDSTLHTLQLLFIGYFSGVFLGLITGITCGYSKRVRYWIDPIIKFLGPIPTSTWIPIMMVLATSLFQGAVFIIALGSWFAVTVASMTGIANVDKDFFDAAKTLGANNRQLVFKVAIPHAMPSILSGCTQAMSSSCTAIMIAEMLGVKSGLGWYMNWTKSWAAYDKMFAALFVICFIFTIVTKALDLIKKRVLRWQNGG